MPRSCVEGVKDDEESINNNDACDLAVVDVVDVCI